MARQIYIVDAYIVDANGTFNGLSGYPKTFDSKNYDGDVEKTYRRAEGNASEAWGGMCKIDTRKVQTVTITSIDGFQMFRKTTGPIPEDPPPEPEPTPEPEPEPVEEG